MTTFLNKVKRATTAMGKGPYDDIKTEECISEATRKAMEQYLKLKNSKSAKDADT